MLSELDISAVRSIPMKDVVTAYGYKVNRHGFMKCPFHQDSHPSLKVYDGSRGWHCFVCNKGGDNIDFVREHDGLSFEAAVRHIAGMFSVPISDGNTISEESRRKMAAKKAERDAAERARIAARTRLINLGHMLQRYESQQAEYEPLSAPWCKLQWEIEKRHAEWARLYAELSR